MSLKINTQGLDEKARHAIAAILDDHAKEMDRILENGEAIAGMQAALQSRTQAKILAVELRGGGESEVARLREDVKKLRREVEVLAIENERLKGRTK